MTTAEEWLIDYSLKTGNAVNANTDLLDMPIRFDGKEVDAFILDVRNNKLVIQLALPLTCEFDSKSNRYKTSDVRALINSNKFLSRFNSEFAKHIQQTKVYTEDYVTNDKLWLLSHEEINSNVGFLKPNDNCTTFEIFKTTGLKVYSRMLINDELNVRGWRLRSAYSNTYSDSYSSLVGGVNTYSYVGYDYAYSTDYGALLPACTIC